MTSIFEKTQEFIHADSRQRRDFMPINVNSLTTKCEALLPKDLIKGKSVLDLGSCLGAMGHWSLSHGAKYYHGIEIQDKFVTKSEVLLRQWGEKAFIEQKSIEEALEQFAARQFDIVIAAGILQIFMAPQNILKLICKVCSDYIAIEASYPPSIRKGFISSDSAILEFCKAACNSDEHDGQFVGQTSILSPKATEWICNMYGFEAEHVNLTPTLTKDNIAYSHSLDDDVLPLRYFTRLHRIKETSKTTLEDIIKTKSKRFYQNWEDAPLNIQVKKQPLEQDNYWIFDDQVANNFNVIAVKHIPQYSKVIDTCIELIKKTQTKNAKIIDVGCATGETLKRLESQGFTNLWGVDNSSAMLKKGNSIKATYIHSENFPIHEAPFDVIIASWTLHFIKERRSYIQLIFDSLSKNGLFFISEKTSMSELMKEYYYDFKRANGVTEEEIKQKETSLKGVLTTYPLAWYYNTLYKVGFKTIDILKAERGFITLCCQR